MRAFSPCGLAVVSLLLAGCDAGDAVTAFTAADQPVAAALGIVPQTVACGASIVADLKLANDLVCPGDALTVNADGIKVDLNGHTITGSATGNGITVRLRQNVVIYGGTIANFTTGILIAQSNHITVKENGFTQNREAVFLNGSIDNVIKENVFWQNLLRGVMLRPTGAGVQSTGNLIVENTLTGNPSGVLVFGQPGNTFRENAISGSSFAAFDLTGGGASGNVFRENLLDANAAAIRFGPGWTGNSFIENVLTQNTCGTFGPSAGNTFSENVFTGNTTDAC